MICLTLTIIPPISSLIIVTRPRRSVTSRDAPSRRPSPREPKEDPPMKLVRLVKKLTPAKSLKSYAWYGWI